MNGANQSVVSEFVFLGLSNSWEIQLLLFCFSCLFYVSSMMGNLLIVVTVSSDPYLHSPMYFLLANLSIIDLIFCSIAAPKMICDLFRKQKVISFGGCIAQIFFSHAAGGTEMVLLIAMSYDRYVAICEPHEPTNMHSDFSGCLDHWSNSLIGPIGFRSQLALLWP